MAGNKNSGRRSKVNEKALADKQQQWRESIEATKILKRLKAFALNENLNGKKVEMSDAQVRVGLGLLRKVLPDLQSTEITGDIEHTHYGLTDGQLDEQISRQARIAGLTAGETPQNRGNGAAQGESGN